MRATTIRSPKRPSKGPETVAERSGWRKTGRYDEAIALCAEFERKYRGRVKRSVFGRTPDGRPMLVLAAADSGALTPQAARKKRLPVVLAQTYIHADEVDGKDAGFWLLRDLLDGKACPGVLKKAVFVFVPVFSVDGHERFGPNNRPNQTGPDEMGWRVTSNLWNLNRDYVKAESPEMRAMLKLLGDWDPIVYADLHATDGAKFEHDISVVVEPSDVGLEPLRLLGVEMREELGRYLSAAGHLPLEEFYPTFNKKDDPESGFSAWSLPPRFSTSYWPLRNRLAVLVETHSWKPYDNRVLTTRRVLESLLLQAASRGAEWLKRAAAADAADRKGARSSVEVSHVTVDPPRMIDFRGYEYKVETSELSGQRRISYDDSKPKIWRVPFYDKLKVSLTVEIPKGGWLVPAAWAPLVGEKLALHGFSFRTLAKAGTMKVEAFRASEVKLSAGSLEGRQTAQVEGAWALETKDYPAGSLVVPAAQRGVRLLAHMLDPRAPDSLAAWGWFNVCWEQREYMEDYVIEDVGREMLKDPAVKAEFETRLRDPEFAASPRERLWFFYRRHPSWDQTYRLYPVCRISRKP